MSRGHGWAEELRCVHPRDVPTTAMQFDGTHACAERIIAWVNAATGYTPELGGNPPILFYYGELRLRTAHGEFIGAQGDWIVRHTSETFQPFKAELFEALYHEAPVGAVDGPPQPSVDVAERSARALEQLGYEYAAFSKERRACFDLAENIARAAGLPTVTPVVTVWFCDTCHTKGGIRHSLQADRNGLWGTIRERHRKCSPGCDSTVRGLSLQDSDF